MFKEGSTQDSCGSTGSIQVQFELAARQAGSRVSKAATQTASQAASQAGCNSSLWVECKINVKSMIVKRKCNASSIKIA